MLSHLDTDMDEGATKPKQSKILHEDQHIVVSDDDLVNKLKGGKNINTEKSEKKAYKPFTNVLKQSGVTELDYW